MFLKMAIRQLSVVYRKQVGQKQIWKSSAQGWSWKLSSGDSQATVGGRKVKDRAEEPRSLKGNKRHLSL